MDFCVTLGGDGTVLHLASVFIEDEPLPPVVSFSLGTLGFLTPFDAADYAPCLERVLAASPQQPVYCTLRTRKRCEVLRCAPPRLSLVFSLLDWGGGVQKESCVCAQRGPAR